MKPRLFRTASSAQTKKLAGVLAGKKEGRVFALRGGLGAGKTTFIQGFARKLGIKERLISPTFLIIRRYRLRVAGYRSLFHIDCYRLKNSKEIAALGFKKIIADPKNVVLIEWADKIKKILPREALWLDFSYGRKENERIIKINAQPSSHRR